MELQKRGHRRGTSDTSTIDFRWELTPSLEIFNIFEFVTNLNFSVGEERMRQTAETSPEVGLRFAKISPISNLLPELDPGLTLKKIFLWIC